MKLLSNQANLRLTRKMIENRRQKIQVTGQFTLDADGHPIKLTDVTRIELVISTFATHSVLRLWFATDETLLPYCTKQ